MKAALASLLLGAALPLAAQPAMSAVSAAGTARAGEPNVRLTVIEDDAARIEELRVRGVTTRIVVTPKGRGAAYEILTGDGSRDVSDGASTSRGAEGRRVWRVLDF